MAITLKTWTHPRTGETRVYVNGPAIPSGVKVWIEAYGNDSWTVKVFADWGIDRRTLSSEVSDAVEKLVGHGCTFEDIVKKASQ